MPTFLTREQCYRILQRELPEDIYPDGAPADYLSTADNDSIAATIASVYASIGRVYANMFAITALEQIDKWEVAIFGENFLALDDATRINKVIAKLRSEFDVSRWSVLTQIASLIPGVVFQLLEPEDLLIDRTPLRGELADLVWGKGWTSGDPAPVGVTVTDDLRNNQASLLALRNDCYRYTVAVFSDTLSQAIKDELEALLTSAEPARSTHSVIYYAASSIAVANEIPNIDRYIKTPAVRADPGSITGIYLGWFGFDGDDTSITFGDVNNSAIGGVFWPFV